MSSTADKGLSWVCGCDAYWTVTVLVSEKTETIYTITIRHHGQKIETFNFYKSFGGARVSMMVMDVVQQYSLKNPHCGPREDPMVSVW